MLPQKTVVAVNRNEEFWPHQVDEQPHLLLAAVAGDVNQSVLAVVVNHVGLAAAQVIDHAKNSLLVAGNNARAQHHRVAGLNVRVLVVVHRGAAQCAHRLALRAADQDHHLLGRKVANLAGVNHQSGRNLDVAQVLRNLCRVHHRAPHHRHLAPVLARQFHGDADAIDRRREATEEELLLGLGENLVEARNDRAFARRVAGPLHIGRVL